MMQTHKIEKSAKTFRSPSQPAIQETTLVSKLGREVRRVRFLNQARDIKLTTRTAELMEILFDIRG